LLRFREKEMNLVLVQGQQILRGHLIARRKRCKAICSASYHLNNAILRCIIKAIMYKILIIITTNKSIFMRTISQTFNKAISMKVLSNYFNIITNLKTWGRLTLEMILMNFRASLIFQ
jgi:hypothetical protein